jgi:hypothetical protein
MRHNSQKKRTTIYRRVKCLIRDPETGDWVHDKPYELPPQALLYQSVPTQQFSTQFI